mmetsp:Transcript_1718/g.3928  ORF Transcript_1718/g.3928 Transcript_1718/m.3928 type:complete len:664 (+) Transcript_1718:73-2064(+)
MSSKNNETAASAAGAAAETSRVVSSGSKKHDSVSTSASPSSPPAADPDNGLRRPGIKTSSVNSKKEGEQQRNRDLDSKSRRRSSKRLSYLRRYDVHTIMKKRKTRNSINLQDLIPLFGGRGDGDSGDNNGDNGHHQTENSPLLKHSSNFFSRPIEMFRNGLRLGHDNDHTKEEDEDDIETGNEIKSNNNSNNTKKKNKGGGWKVVKKHMDDGDFLLERLLENDNSNDSNNTYGSTGHTLANEFGSQQDTFYSCTATTNTTTRPGSNRATTTDHNVVSTRQLRQEAMEQYHNDITVSPKTCLLAIAIYLIISIFAFCFILEPEWTVIDSCYFAVTTFTTTGYGDLVPTSVVSHVFTAVYALLGVAVLGLALGILGSKMVEIQGDKEWGSTISREYDAMTLFDATSSHDGDSVINNNTNNNDSAMSSNSSEAAGSDEETGRTFHHKHLTREQQREAIKDFERTVESTGSVFSLKRFLVLLGVAVSMAYAIGRSSGWNLYQTVYYYIITGCTIGYGELTPETQLERFFGIFFVPLAVSVTGYVLAYVADSIVDNLQQKAFNSRVTMHKELTVDDLRILDVDGDGTVTYTEFLEFMLLAMKKVDPGLLDSLREYFDKLDVTNTGVLSKEDLIETARRKLKSPNRKSELAEYKRQLLNIASSSHDLRR